MVILAYVPMAERPQCAAKWWRMASGQFTCASTSTKSAFPSLQRVYPSVINSSLSKLPTPLPRLTSPSLRKVETMAHREECLSGKVWVSGHEKVDRARFATITVCVGAFGVRGCELCRACMKPQIIFRGKGVVCEAFG